MQISIVLIDDLLDSDPRGLYRQIGSAAAANLASSFQAAGLEAIVRSQGSLEIKLEIMAALNKMVHKTALGQYWDVQNPTNEEDYWLVVCTKSSPFFQTGLQIGALLGGASVETAQEIGRLGGIYGEMIQLHDDINDALEVPANPDWVTGRQSLPLLFASTIEHPERERFQELRPKVSDAQALSAAQLILVRCGAVSYVLHELLERNHEARKILHNLVLPQRDKLEGLFAEIIEPVHGLMMEVKSR
jgi:geranylgeranyl pyrophosphate synthase